MRPADVVSIVGEFTSTTFGPGFSVSTMCCRGARARGSRIFVTSPWWAAEIEITPSTGARAAAPP